MPPMSQTPPRDSQPTPLISTFTTLCEGELQAVFVPPMSQTPLEFLKRPLVSTFTTLKFLMPLDYACEYFFYSVKKTSELCVINCSDRNEIINNS